MKSILSIALVSALVSAGPVLASNEMMLLSPDLSNKVVVAFAGNDNRLVINQALQGEGLGNSVRVSISGNRNGGAADLLFTSVATKNGLLPGSVTQTGLGNLVEMDVTGDDNLFAVAQLGNDNTVQATIIGVGNQASVSQMGNGNFASFTQNGMGNIISVRQVSW